MYSTEIDGLERKATVFIVYRARGLKESVKHILHSNTLIIKNM